MDITERQDNVIENNKIVGKVMTRSLTHKALGDEHEQTLVYPTAVENEPFIS